MKTTFWLLCSWFFLVGCAEQQPLEPRDETEPTPLEGVVWQLHTIAVDPMPRQVPDSVQLQLQLTDGQIRAGGECNQIGGTYSVSGTRLTVDQIQMTEMFCAGRSNWESDMMQHLTYSQSYRVAGDTLEINCGDMGGLVFFQTGEGQTRQN